MDLYKLRLCASIWLFWCYSDVQCCLDSLILNVYKVITCTSQDECRNRTNVFPCNIHSFITIMYSNYYHHNLYMPEVFCWMAVRLITIESYLIHLSYNILIRVLPHFENLTLMHGNWTNSGQIHSMKTTGELLDTYTSDIGPDDLNYIHRGVSQTSNQVSQKGFY